MGRSRHVERGDLTQAVLVTGASSGMGEDAARYLNELGYLVIPTVRREVDAERLRRAVPNPDGLRPVLLDVASPEQFDGARAEVEGILGTTARLVGIFSNAGIAAFTGQLSAELCPIETQQRVMDVNFFGGVRVVQTFLPLLRDGRGTIVFNTAMMAHTVLPFNAGYAASKCALEGYADSLRRETAGQGIRVSMIEAAAITTDLDTKQDPATVPGDGPYGVQRAMTELFISSQQRLAGKAFCSPRRVSELVVDAIQSPSPKTRYRVGGGWQPIYVLGLLPDRVQDRVFATALRQLDHRRTSMTSAR